MSQDGQTITANTDDPVTITLESVSYRVKVPVRTLSLAEKIKGITWRGLGKPEMVDKYLLTDISATFKPGSFTALMGPSGSGKSTLLDVIAERKTTGVVEGTILVNGKQPDISYPRVVGYVEQVDVLICELTPRQIFYYCAKLRLPRDFPEEKVNERVDNIIEELQLTKCQYTIIGDAALKIAGLSGGQVKRVNFGIELLTNPQVMFLDEPTTGLDSTTSFEVMESIRRLTSNSRTTIATIHQPSADVFRMFDRLLLLVAGRCVYLDEAKNCVGYFESLGFGHRPRMNPADFLMIAICSSGSMSKDEEGEFQKLITVPDGMYDDFFVDNFHRSKMYTARQESLAITKDEMREKISAEMATVDFADLSNGPVQFTNNRFHNFYYILVRQILLEFTSIRYWVTKATRILFSCFVIASTFHSQESDDVGVYGIFSVLNFCVMIFAFSGLSNISTIITQRMFFTRERHSGSYQVLPYYLAVVIAEFPAHIMETTLWSVVVYWAVGMKSSASSFFIFYFLLLAVADTGQAIAQTFAFLCVDSETAQAALFPVIMIMITFSGFYARPSQIPDYWIWAYYISYIAYAYNAIALNQFPPDDPTTFVQCDSVGNNCVDYPNIDILNTWGIVDMTEKLWVSSIALVGWWVFWRIVAYTPLRFVKHGAK